MDYGNSSDKVMYLDYGIHMTRIALELQGEIMMNIVSCILKQMCS